MKTKKIPFNIEKAKAGAKVVTRDGYPVRIGFFDLKVKGLRSFPIVGAIDRDGKEDVRFFTAEGKFSSIFEEDGYDLFIEVEEETDNYNPYKEVVKSIADMVERYSAFGSDLVDFYDNVKVKCREAVEYEKKWNKEQEEQKPSDEFKIMPDKWYVCTLGWESCGWDGDWKFVEGSTYLGSEILQCYPMDEKEIQDHVRLWTICDAKPGDVLAIGWKDKHGHDWQKIVIFKSLTEFSVEGYGNTFKNNELAFEDESVPHLSNTWTKNLHPATKEQRELLFQKIKEAGYKWDTNKKELREIREVKPRRMTNQELSWWLQEHPEEHRECKCKYSDSYRVFNTLSYMEDVENKLVPDFYFIRKNGGEWQEPLIEI